MKTQELDYINMIKSIKGQQVFQAVVLTQKPSGVTTETVGIFEDEETAAKAAHREWKGGADSYRQNERYTVRFEFGEMTYDDDMGWWECGVLDVESNEEGLEPITLQGYVFKHIIE